MEKKSEELTVVFEKLKRSERLNVKRRCPLDVKQNLEIFPVMMTKFLENVEKIIEIRVLV
jgi:hypothetical protein